jgi:BTB/POZ domain
MLTADMKERASAQIELKQVKLKTGQDLLFYLYNRQLREGSDLVGLLGLADQYDLQELKIWCAQQLAASVNKANYSERLRIAELHDISTLKGAVLKFIAGNVDRLC